MESQLHAVPWPPDHLDGLHCIFSSLEISNVSQTRVQNVAVQMWPHQCRDERINHFPQLANAAQYAISFQHHKSTPWLMFNVLLPGNPGSCPDELLPTQPALMQQVPPSQRQDFTSILVENSWKQRVWAPRSSSTVLALGYWLFTLIRISSLTWKIFLICQFRWSIPTRRMPSR